MTHYFYKHPRTFTLSVWLGMILAMLLLSFFTSCAVHKTAYKHTETVDSSSVRTEQQSDVSRHDSSLTYEKSDGWTRETVIEYSPDDTNVVQLMHGQMDSSGAYRLSKAGSDKLAAIIYGNYKPTKITIRETGTTNTRQTGTFTNLDSTGSLRHDSTRLAKTDDNRGNTVDVKPTIGLCVLYTVVGLVVLMGVGWVVRKFVV
jgi:hypothetical protein